MKTLIIALYPYQGRGLDSWHDHGAGMTYECVKSNGHDVSFLDMKTLRNDQELEHAMVGYDLISFGLKSSYYAIGMKVIAIAKRLGSKVLVGGYHATAAPEQLLENPDIDWVLKGESEITFSKFLEWPEFYDKEIIGEKTQNLDDLPFFDRTIYQSPLEDCNGWWYGGRKNMVSVCTARGCPYQCAFCQPLENNHFGTKLRRRSVDSVIDELLWLKKLHNPECLMIHDDTFLLQHKWLEEFIAKYPKVGLPFWAAGRADGICKYPDHVKELVKVGWELISVGFESGSQRILDKMKKGTTVEQNIEAGKIIKECGAKVYANYMLGLPWETKEDIQDTARMADIIRAEMPSWAFFTPYPGCGLGQECIDKDWSLLDRFSYDRCPSGRKVKHVDYDYLNAVLRGYRENPRSTVLCDIIIPTYNNEYLTIQCLESIQRCTKEGTYRVIWVDNASKDCSKIEPIIGQLNHLSIKMPKNEGFVCAVNKGLEASNASYVCLLNNDTIVSDRWLEKLITHLERDKGLGIVGPLTMFSQGPGMDSHHSLSLHKDLIPSNVPRTSIPAVNEFLENNYKDRTIDISFVAFLCAVIKREVINKVGHLDPNYAMGMWDDNDYNMGARAAGFKCELAIDTCIYHKGRSTFSLIEKTEKFNIPALLKKNKEYLDRKWEKKAKCVQSPISKAMDHSKLTWRQKIGETV
jgi:radical SAM superfamily enzyme YgiQ (UPF0313 family)